MDFTCAFCRTRVPINPAFDESTCPGCKQVLNNGLDKKRRSGLEKSQYWMDRPRSVMARAASYSNRIYDFSTHGAPMKLDEVEKKVSKRYGAQAAGTAQALWASGRGFLDIWDGGVGAMIVRVDGVTGGYKWCYLYVVFRGSRGDKNPFNTGFDAETGMNLDWRANYENEQTRPLWAATDVKVHQGFLAIYSSMRDNLKIELANQKRAAAREGHKPVVIITGHSLGAGIAQVCAHDFHFSGFDTSCACFPFCPPRAGNLGFVRSFNAQICDKEVFYPSEKRRYTRAVSSIQGMDPVSSEQKRGLMHGTTSEDGKMLDEALGFTGLVKRGLYSKGFGRENVSEMIKAEEKMLYGQVASPYVRKWRQIQKQSIFYHIKNLFLLQLTGFHHPGSAESNAYSRFH
ncbi:MAG: hypothetical protein AAGD13_22580 [Pseudomonadota bacterium]